MEALIQEVKGSPTAEGIENIFFPGELEDIHTQNNLRSGIQVTDKTWDSLSKLATETQTALPIFN
jgi:LDH2 family malate/lactate/ureidoglycolate dehydrogenase